MFVLKRREKRIVSWIFVTIWLEVFVVPVRKVG